MHERRRDPRTSKPFSVSNLLRTRAERAGALVAVAGTPEGFVLGASRPGTDPQAQRLAAHAARELFGPGATDWVALEGKASYRLLAVRFEAEGRPAFVAALVDRSSQLDLEDLARSLQRILSEPAVGVAA